MPKQLTPKQGDLRLWWIPNPPREPYHVAVKSPEDAKLIFDALSHYDLYLGEQVIVTNAGGMEVFNAETNEWEEWEDDEGRPLGEGSH